MESVLPPIDLEASMAFAEAIRNALYIVAFGIYVWAFAMLGYKSKDGPKVLSNGIIKIGILIATMVFIPQFYIKTAEFCSDTFQELADEAFAKDEDSKGKKLQYRVDAMMTDLYNNQETKEDSLTGWALDSMLQTLGEWITNGLVWLSRVFRLIVRAVQQILLLLMLAIAPLMFAFGSIPETQSLFTSYLLNTLAIILWGIGFAFADLILFAGTKWIVAFISISLTGSGAVAAGAAHIVGAPISISVMIALLGTMLGMTVALNILGPLVITALLNGKSPAGAAMQSAQMGIQLSNSMANIGRGLNTPRDRDHKQGGETILGKAAAPFKGMAMGAGAMGVAAIGAGNSPSLFQTGGFSAAAKAYSGAYSQAVNPSSKGGQNSKAEGGAENPTPLSQAKSGLSSGTETPGKPTNRSSASSSTLDGGGEPPSVTSFMSSPLSGMGIGANMGKSVGEGALYTGDDDELISTLPSVGAEETGNAPGNSGNNDNEPAFQTGKFGDLREKSKEELHKHKD